jgi:hypothetical protein
MKPITAIVWGLEGSGKTTVGLTFPKPLFHMELDLGGFERSIWRLEDGPDRVRVERLEADTNLKTVKWKDWDVINKPYVVPIQMEKLMGVKKEGTTVRFPRQVIGYKELWQRFVIDYVYVCQQSAVKTIQIDSTTLWSICHTSLLQEKQEVQLAGGMSTGDSKFREKLQPVEFPNDRMRSLINTADGCGKNLVLIHYPRNIYRQKINPRTGEIMDYKSEDIEPDGFKQTTQLADIVIWTMVEKGSPVAKISIKCGVPGLGMQAVGLQLPEPSYDGLEQLVKSMKGE